MKTSPSQRTIAKRVDRAASAVTVQQAEKAPVGGDRFLQIAGRNQQKKQHKLMRVPFQVSRLMEFCSLRELQNQTGHNVWDWPLVVLKELLDNALDACEEVAVAPVIKVSVSPNRRPPGRERRGRVARAGGGDRGGLVHVAARRPACAARLMAGH
jgi:hypothetical protein